MIKNIMNFLKILNYYFGYNKTKTRYKMLFDGFIRVNCNIKIIIIPDVIIRLISDFYFPKF